MANQNIPLISVVIPAYNQDKYLALAVESVLSQTFTGYEIIIIDDGSTDQTPEIAHQFGDQVRYVWQENQGLAAARNTGIRHAQGRYVALLDSDDLWEPGYLARMVRLVEEHPQGHVYYCGWRAIDSDGKLLPQSSSRVVSPEKMYTAILRQNFLNNCTTIMHRDTIINAGLYDPDFRRLQDWEFWLRLLRTGHRFIGTADRLVYYRMHEESLSTDPTGGQQAALAIARKLYGPDDGQWESWTQEKRRAYGGTYRYHVLSALQRQRDWTAAALHLRRALQIDHSLAFDLDLFYELAVGPQPAGYRGSKERLDLTKNAAQVEAVLAHVFSPPLPHQLVAAERDVRSTTFWALGSLAYNLGQFQLSQQYLWRVIRARPELLFSWKLFSTLVKSYVGRDGLDRLRRMRHAAVDK